MEASYHPANLALRFVLELTVLASLAHVGWTGFQETWPSIAAACLLPALAMTVWAVFAVPGDRSRSGRAPVAISGRLRLSLESMFFAVGALGLWMAGLKVLSVSFTAVVLVHYGLSGARVKWLLAQPPGG